MGFPCPLNFYLFLSQYCLKFHSLYNAFHVSLGRENKFYLSQKLLLSLLSTNNFILFGISFVVLTSVSLIDYSYLRVELLVYGS